MTASFPDHFSATATTYARFRPHYPDTLFDWIAAQAPARDAVWDCACGNGQATLPLADRFSRVIGTDASAEQLSAATPHPGVDYRIATAEASGLDPQSVSAVTVAQALHWFRLPEFFAEVDRVTRPGGLIAAWSYGVAELDDPALTMALRQLHDDVVGPYWPIERGHVDLGYQAIELPFQRVTPPPFTMAVDWTLDQLTGYLRTWSATQRYIAARGTDPVTSWSNDLGTRWGTARHRVTWPLTVIAGRVG